MQGIRLCRGISIAQHTSAESTLSLICVDQQQEYMSLEDFLVSVVLMSQLPVNLMTKDSMAELLPPASMPDNFLALRHNFRSHHIQAFLLSR